MEYYDLYLQRLNRYGINYQQRIQNKREQEFDAYLEKSIYRVHFEYDDVMQIGSFEKYKQDDTETLHYLLTKINLNIPSGTILLIPDKNKELKPWLVYYLEQIKASGYNRYIMLRMTHMINWIGRDKIPHNSWVYLYGQEDNMLKDELKSRSRMDTLYEENLKSSFLVMPKNGFLKKDDYFEIGEEPFKESYRVTGYDRQSTEGIEYVTIDPIYQYDLSPTPTYNSETDDKTDFYWLNQAMEPED